MKTNYEILRASVHDSFVWEDAVSNLLNIVRMAIMRNDYKDAAKHATVLCFLGIELEELGLTADELNNIVMNLCE